MRDYNSLSFVSLDVNQFALPRDEECVGASLVGGDCFESRARSDEGRFDMQFFRRVIAAAPKKLNL